MVLHLGGLRPKHSTSLTKSAAREQQSSWHCPDVSDKGRSMRTLTLAGNKWKSFIIIVLKHKEFATRGQSYKTFYRRNL